MADLGKRIGSLCLSWPGTTEDVKWGADHVFSVNGKMFVILPYESEKPWLSLKASSQAFADLVSTGHFSPAPYLARANWVMTKTPEDLDFSTLAELIRESYELVVAKLSKKAQRELGFNP
jgi:predicted DNA-binding protein (MmcQ/YjbR family)